MNTALPFIDLARAHRARGTVALPGSKSISNRVLLLAALCEGDTRISGLLDSDDTRVMIAALRRLGLDVREGAAGEAVLAGAGGAFSETSADLFMGNAGTAIRPLTAALALMGGNYSLSGVPRMHERPIGDLVDALRALGARIDYLGQEGYPPLRIGSGRIDAVAPIAVQGSVSSQFLTALLLAAPIFTRRSGKPLVFEVSGELISKPYIAITLNLMSRFGVQVERDGWQRFTVPAKGYVSPGAIAVEGDASTASYLLSLGAIGGGPLRVTGVGADSIQGDVAFADTLSQMGARIEKGPDWIEASGPEVAAGDRLRAFDTDFNLIPDAAMTAAALALFADGPCRLRNIGSWRVKETDRIHAMQTELRKLGAQVESGDDWLRVTPPTPGAWRDAAIATYDDHRMAMCFSLAAFGPAAVRILEPGCVSKTFPAYFDVYRGLIVA